MTDTARQCVHGVSLEADCHSCAESYGDNRLLPRPMTDTEARLQELNLLKTHLDLQIDALTRTVTVESLYRYISERSEYLRKQGISQ